MASALPATTLLHSSNRGSPRQVVSTPWLATQEVRSTSRLSTGSRTLPRSGVEGGARLQRVATERVTREQPPPPLAAGAKVASTQPTAQQRPQGRSRSLSLEPQPQGRLGVRSHDEPPSRQQSPQPQLASRQVQEKQRIAGEKQRLAEERRRPYYAKAKDLRTHLEREADHLRRREELKKRKEAQKLVEQEEELRECTFRPQLIAGSPKTRSRAQSPNLGVSAERTSAAVDVNAVQAKLAQLAERQASATVALQALAVDEARLWKRLCTMHADICERIRQEAEAELYSSGLSTIEEVGLPMEEIQRRAREAFQPAQVQAEGELYSRRLALVQELEAIEAQAMMMLRSGALIDKAKALGIEFGLAEHARRSLPPAGTSHCLLLAPAGMQLPQDSSGRGSPSSRSSACGSRRRSLDGAMGTSAASASPSVGGTAPRLEPAPAPAQMLVQPPGGSRTRGQVGGLLAASASASPGALRSPSASSVHAVVGLSGADAAGGGCPGVPDGPSTPRSKLARGLLEEHMDFPPVRRRLDFPVD